MTEQPTGESTTDPEQNPNNPDIVPDEHGAKADRPGGPGQSATNPVEPGRLSPAPDPDSEEEDEVITARREHQQESPGTSD